MWFDTAPGPQAQGRFAAKGWVCRGLLIARKWPVRNAVPTKDGRGRRDGGGAGRRAEVGPRAEGRRRAGRGRRMARSVWRDVRSGMGEEDLDPGWGRREDGGLGGDAGMTEVRWGRRGGGD